MRLKPPHNDPDRRREIFLLGQPIWRAEGSPEARWRLAMREDEPSDETSQGEHAFRPPPIDDELSADELSALEPGLAGPADSNDTARWVRMKREEVVQYALSADPAWSRVGIVCTAGLGKTTNLEWLTVEVNRRSDGRGKDLAACCDVGELPCAQDHLQAELLNAIRNNVANVASESLERMLRDGRVIWLLDSLDQTDPNPNGDALQGITALATGRYSACRIWVAGRPYAFRLARPGLAKLGGWQFLRIGELGEAECRHLLEVSGRRR